ncbi:amidase [Rhodococcoides fascians]|uniref:amidase n=1 Tax=Rhodococcoides fascians TaxID=1828 RepID=UPI001D998268|nr:amidase [Rhodococcus fascians]MDQ0282244.1 Asp-tRNA(Asn)/Glu-tRNA(Gln) amidotransferase A subunit family amidase [Rhodococcus fascians]CAH0251783.1 Putative amidase AmiD [Rhodococcus fascians]
MSIGSPLYEPWSLADLVADLRAGRSTVEDAWRRSQRRIDDTEDDLAAWVVHAPPVELEDPPGLLGGIPLGVKDIVDVAGLPTRCGTDLYAARGPAEADAAVVQAWRTAGAVPAGKTVSTEFAFFAPGPTRNPADPSRTPGGSSSGSAAAVASGQVPLALGSQTAGSVTRPASYCGVASMVMTRGRHSTEGVTGLAASLDSHGFYAAQVRDLACAWSAFVGQEVVLGCMSAPPRVLLWDAGELGVVEPDMADALARLGRGIRADGAGQSAFPAGDAVSLATAAHAVVMSYEAARERSALFADVDRLSAPLTALLQRGAATATADYHAACITVAETREHILRLFDSVDVIVGPAAPGAAPEGLTATGDPALSRAWQAWGLPVVTVPGLTDGRGLPLGIQVIGPPNSEAELLAGASWISAVIASQPAA